MIRSTSNAAYEYRHAKVRVVVAATLSVLMGWLLARLVTNAYAEYMFVGHVLIFLFCVHVTATSIDQLKDCKVRFVHESSRDNAYKLIQRSEFIIDDELVSGADMLPYFEMDIDLHRFNTIFMGVDGRWFLSETVLNKRLLPAREIAMQRISEPEARKLKTNWLSR